MLKSKGTSYFWPSYTDLMTSMFFIMLVLYVLTFVVLKQQQNEAKVKADQYDRLMRIEKSINEIDKEHTYFDYNALYKKHILKIRTSFHSGSSNISDMPAAILKQLLGAGQKIKDLFDHIPDYENIKYLVIIEGQASNDSYDGNDELSYKRALALKKYWKVNRIDLEGLNNCELIIAGSGIHGKPRVIPDVPPANQRFLIHIIPKPGKK